MTPEELSALHSRAMTNATPWSPAAFTDTLAAAGTFLCPVPRSSLEDVCTGAQERPGQRPGPARGAGFLLGRVLEDEAELLTLAIEPALRRRGLGRALLAAFEAEATSRGATSAFLEVAETNAPALALYSGAGWTEAGRRPGYYPREGTDPESALILVKTIGVP